MTCCNKTFGIHDLAVANPQVVAAFFRPAIKQIGGAKFHNLVLQKVQRAGTAPWSPHCDAANGNKIATSRGYAKNKQLGPRDQRQFLLCNERAPSDSLLTPCRGYMFVLQTMWDKQPQPELLGRNHVHVESCPVALSSGRKAQQPMIH